ncbi:MAG TPA: 3-deoxy-manno-octulosonate cytidylyltransferase [Chromatiaceae bacterium]|nr:3-deoxy-manno-octulosonate cytidylyltransferase [Chromatiaceae bacterium]
MVIVIPARYAATRLPGRPLRELAGKPMLQHVHERALASRASEVIIATDDERIAREADGFGARVCMTDPGHASGTERVAEVIEVMGWSDDEVVVNLQGDEPLMPPPLLDQVAEDVQRHEAADMATLAAHLESPDQLFDPATVKVVLDRKGYALYFSRVPIPWQRDEMKWGEAPSMELARKYLRHIGLYAYRAGFVREYVKWPSSELEQTESLEQLRVLWQGRRIHVSMAAEPPPAGVDTPEDLQRVERLLRERSA